MSFEEKKLFVIKMKCIQVILNSVKEFYIFHTHCIKVTTKKKKKKDHFVVYEGGTISSLGRRGKLSLSLQTLLQSPRLRECHGCWAGSLSRGRGSAARRPASV